MLDIKSFFTVFFILTVLLLSRVVISQESDHEKAIQAVQNEEILPLDQILSKIQDKFEGRILGINLTDNEKGLFGWVYDIRLINNRNKVVNIRVDAGTSTVLLIESGD